LPYAETGWVDEEDLKKSKAPMRWPWDLKPTPESKEANEQAPPPKNPIEELFGGIFGDK